MKTLIEQEQLGGQSFYMYTESLWLAFAWPELGFKLRPALVAGLLEPLRGVESDPRVLLACHCCLLLRWSTQVLLDSL